MTSEHTKLKHDTLRDIWSRYIHRQILKGKNEIYIYMCTVHMTKKWVSHAWPWHVFVLCARLYTNDDVYTTLFKLKTVLRGWIVWREILKNSKPCCWLKIRLNQPNNLKNNENNSYKQIIHITFTDKCEIFAWYLTFNLSKRLTIRIYW